MTPIWRVLLPIVTILVVIEILLLSSQDLDKDSFLTEEKREEDSYDTVQQLARKVHLIESRNNRKDWELWAEKAYEQQGQNVWKLESVKIRFFSEKGIHFEVRGQRGILEVKSQNMLIFGDVVVTSENGYQFSTSTIKYQSELRRLVAPRYVQMKGPRDKSGHRMFLTGDQMETTLQDSLMKVFGRVRAKKKIDGKYMTYINSQEAIFSGEKYLAEFSENVEIDVNNSRITGSKASFKYGSSLGEVQSILVSGGVKVSDLAKWATSDKLEMSFIDNRFVFTGHPRVVQNNDELRGEKIVFFDGGKKVKVYKARAKVDKKSVGNDESVENY